MSGLSISSFKGVVVSKDRRKLPPGFAVSAVNCKLQYNQLRPWFGNKAVATLAKAGTIKSIYRFNKTAGDDNSGTWFHWNNAVDVVRGQVKGDTAERTYFTGDGAPKVTDISIATSGGGSGYPTASYNLGVPQPPAGMYPTVVHTDQQTVMYAVSYVEEHPAASSTFYEGGNSSSTVVSVTRQPGQAVSLSNIPVYSGARNIVKKHLYRSNGGPFKYVATLLPADKTYTDNTLDVDLGGTYPLFADRSPAVPVPVAGDMAGLADEAYDPQDISSRSYVVVFVSNWSSILEEGVPSTPTITVDVAPGDYVDLSGIPNPSGPYNITSKKIYRTAFDGSGSVYMLVAEIAANATTFRDTVLDKDLGEVLPSASFYQPPSDMHSLICLPNGIMMGASNNLVCISKAYLPHAWDPLSQVALNYPIVGMGWFDNTAVALTVDNPHLITGASPEYMSEQEVPINHGCVSKRSIVSTPFGVIYASPDGLVIIGPGGQNRVVTEAYMLRDEWQALDPSSIHGAMFSGYYIGFYDNGTDRGGFVLDPQNPEIGMTFLDFYASALYSDPVANKLYMCIDDGGTNKIYQWDKDSASPMTYSWESGSMVSPVPLTLQAGRVLSDSYLDTTVEVYYRDASEDWQLWHSQDVSSGQPFRMPGGAAWREWAFKVIGSDNVSAIEFAECISDLERSNG